MSVQVSNLEEYWQYNFIVNATTVKGSNASDTSTTFTTSQAGKSHIFFVYVFVLGVFFVS